jgi:DNA polymerase theta
MIKRVLADSQAKALLVLPYVALVQEKVRYLRAVVQDLCRPSTLPKDDDTIPMWKRRAENEPLRVVGFFGGGKVRSTWADFDIGVCTMEKVCTFVCLALYGLDRD